MLHRGLPRRNILQVVPYEIASPRIFGTLFAILLITVSLVVNNRVIVHLEPVVRSALVV